MSHRTKGRNKAGDATTFRLRFLSFVFGFSLLLVISPAQARDAAFLDPGTGGASSDDAIRVEPKNDIDIGESILNVARRVDLFFVNQSGQPVKVEKIAVNGDGNVATEIAGDDCSKQVTIPPGSRCNVEVSITPSSPGAWSAEVLMTHDGTGRIARARFSGKTSGTVSGEKKDMGLALSTKEINPVNFGDVDISGGKIVRSALMVNDSAEPITLYSIDVIEASNGLQRLDQGCAVDMELKPGESCPVTLVWTPKEPGQVSTDLIIRHSGRLGFAVIPIRGAAKGIASDRNRSANTESVSKSNSIPAPPSAQDLEKAANGKILPVSAAALASAASGAGAIEGKLTLIGTVGNRAVFLKPDGRTAIANVGDEIDLGEKRAAKILQVASHSADVLMDGKKKTLFIETSPELVARASSPTKTKDASTKEEPANSPPVPPVGVSGAPSGGLSESGSSYGAAMSGVGK